VAGVEVQEPEERPGLLLLFSEAEANGDACPAHSPTTIGREPDRSLFVDDDAMSRHHATVVWHAGGARIRDEGSRNGTFLNGVRLEDEAELGSGDLIRCGTTLLLRVCDARAYRGWRQRGLAGPLLGGPTIEAIARRIAAVGQEHELEVLITGESGTGKELAARALHDASGRSGAFVPVNCAAVPADLFEAELFGARKGAYTGAAADRPGLLQAADGGTLFLDEIGELPLPLQAKLLRVVELREARPLGGQPVRVDVRIVAATNRELKEAVAARTFREDLYFRLCGATIEMPPLRERREDILLLTLAQLERAAPRPRLTALFLERLLLARWPGNVRELQQVLRQALLEVRLRRADQLLPQHLPPTLEATGAESERDSLRRALARHHGRVTRAAAELGLSRAHLYRRLEAHGLRAEDFR